MSNYQDPNVPAYGTPEYAEWYRKNVNPQWDQQPFQRQPPQKNRHPVRWTLAGVFVALVVGGIAAGAATSSGKSTAGKHIVAAPTEHASTKSEPENSKSNPPADPTVPVTTDDNAVGGGDEEVDPTPTPTPSGPQFFPIGHSVDFTETSFDETDEAHINVQLVGTYTAPITQDEFNSNEPPHYGTYRVFKVTMHVIKGSVDDVDTSSFRWESANHQVYDGSEGNSYESGFNSDDELSWNGAAQGQIVTGELIFDIPPGSGKLELVNYDSSIIGGWTVK